MSPTKKRRERETIRELLDAMKEEILDRLADRVTLAVAKGQKEYRESYELANQTEHEVFTKRIEDLEDWRRRHDRVVTSMELPPKSVSTATGEPPPLKGDSA